MPAGTGSLLNEPVRPASASGMTCSRGAGPTESSPMKQSRNWQSALEEPPADIGSVPPSIDAQTTSG